jgi:hypothetical protein
LKKHLKDTETDVTTQVLAPRQKGLKDELDRIDQECIREVRAGFYASRLKIEISMWKKGRVIVKSTPLNLTPNFSKLEEETGRSRQYLKIWFELYTKYPNKDKFLEEYAKPRAETWTKKALTPPYLLSTVLEDGSKDGWVNMFLDRLIDKLTTWSKIDMFENEQAYFNAFSNLFTREDKAWLGYKIELCTNISELVLLIDALRELGYFFARIHLESERKAGELLKEIEAEKRKKKSVEKEDSSSS